ncbi:MAG TPA: hypothetical protein VEB21_15255 [Terriglobales bacterium]|nr:hypothetical protein [Terriglobales bacterium]
MFRSNLRVAAALAALMMSTSVFAATTPQQKCQTAKLKAQGKLEVCLKKQRSNVILGKADESAECLTKFQTALGKADTKAAAAMPPTSCRYIDNGDGTVSDLNTGLVWEKKDDLSGIHDKDNGYSWASSGTTPNVRSSRSSSAPSTAGHRTTAPLSSRLASRATAIGAYRRSKNCTGFWT